MGLEKERQKYNCELICLERGGAISPRTAKSSTGFLIGPPWLPSLPPRWRCVNMTYHQVMDFPEGAALSSGLLGTLSSRIYLDNGDRPLSLACSGCCASSCRRRCAAASCTRGQRAAATSSRFLHGRLQDLTHGVEDDVDQ